MTAFVQPATTPIRLITRDEATALGKKILEQGSSRVRIEHVVRATTHITNTRSIANDDGEQLVISTAPSFTDAFYPIAVVTSQFDEQALHDLLARAAIHVRRPGVVDPEPADDTRMAATFPSVQLWHDTTVHAMTETRPRVVPTFVKAFTDAGVTGSAMVGMMARSSLYMYLDGLTAFVQETDAECSVTARLPDGTSSGWGGQAARDWMQIHPDAIVQRAIDDAKQGENPVAFEPGRRTVIFAPEAVAQLMRFFAVACDAEQTDKGRTPLSKSVIGGSRLGQQIMDPRLTIVSDPADPDGGYPPFFEAFSNTSTSGRPGIPSPRMTWVEHGILTNLAYSVQWGLKKGKPYAAPPLSFRMEGGTTSIEEMIASCAEGLYVRQLGSVDLVDSMSGMLTGVTMHGCFLIKDGKIVRPVKNLRFLDSPFLFLNRVEAIGSPVRVAMGNMSFSKAELGGSGGSWWPPAERIAQWPRPPVIVPPLMIRDFNFSTMVDAV